MNRRPVDIKGKEKNCIFTIKAKIMATILKSGQREFEENPNKIDHYRIFTDRSRVRKGIYPQNLNKDAQVNYFHGEDNIIGKWKQIEDKKELEEYEYAKMREQDERGEIELAEDRAKHTEKIEIAKEMILENEPIARIVRYTKLDVEIIQKIIDIQNIK